MMREILFRAKRRVSGVWVYGFYVKHTTDKTDALHFIYREYAETDCEEIYPDRYDIEPDTVCQWTGLRDKNGTKIFEGDIVAFDDAEADYEGYHDNVFTNHGVVKYDDESMCYYYTNRQTVRMDDLCGEDVQVIGNKWDNPELLEVKS